MAELPILQLPSPIIYMHELFSLDLIQSIKKFTKPSVETWVGKSVMTYAETLISTYKETLISTYKDF